MTMSEDYKAITDAMKDKDYKALVDAMDDETKANHIGLMITFGALVYRHSLRMTPLAAVERALIEYGILIYGDDFDYDDTEAMAAKRKWADDEWMKMTKYLDESEPWEQDVDEWKRQDEEKE